MTEARQYDQMIAYIMVRTDIPSLGVGKGFAHAMHAGNHLTWKLAVEPLAEGREIPEAVMQWHKQGGGFGTTLSVGGSNQITKERLYSVTAAVEMLGHYSGLVTDATYPYHVNKEVMGLIDPSIHTLPPQPSASGFCCFRKEVTAGWVLGPKSDLAVILGQFDLTPNIPF